MVASAIRSIYEQPDEHAASEQLRRVADSLTARFPAVAELLTEAEPDLLGHFNLPRGPSTADPEREPAGAAPQGDPGVALVRAGRAATAARTVGDRAEA